MAGFFACCANNTGMVEQEVEKVAEKEACPKYVRTASKDNLLAEEALMLLKQGNERHTGTAQPRKVDECLRKSLHDKGQNPAAVVIGCADSRCPPETLFDAMPGDLFVLRNAGNTLASAEASIVASTEYAVGALGTKLVLVLGHTKCGALVGATKLALCPPVTEEGKTHLDRYLAALTPAAMKAREKLSADASTEEIAAEAINVNVFSTIEKLLEVSGPVREKVASGEVQVHGGLYDMLTGEVTFMGQHPKVKEMARFV